MQLHNNLKQSYSRDLAQLGSDVREEEHDVVEALFKGLKTKALLHHLKKFLKAPLSMGDGEK